MIFNAPEANSNLKDEVNRGSNVQFLLELDTLCEANIDVADVSNGICFGQKKETERPRLLFVSFARLETKNKLLTKNIKAKASR